MQMNMDQQKKDHFQHRIKVNKQRNQRKRLLELIPAHISQVLENTEYLTSPAREDVLQKVQQRWNGELYTYDFRSRYPEFVKAFSWEQEVISYVQTLTIWAGQVYLYLGVPDSPVFVADREWVRANFAVLWQTIDYEDIWVISQEADEGIIVCGYVGYLAENPNPAEVYYEVVSWDGE
jgi:hypothetical protein